MASLECMKENYYRLDADASLHLDKPRHHVSSMIRSRKPFNEKTAFNSNQSWYKNQSTCNQKPIQERPFITRRYFLCFRCCIPELSWF